MHELGITRRIVEICAERAGGERVRRVRVEIGRLSAVLPDAVRFCFDVCTQGTAVAGATLDIIETPGRAICEACGRGVALDDLPGSCPCGSTRLRVIAGEELRVKDMELV